MVWIDALRKRKYPKCGKDKIIIITTTKTFSLITSYPWLIWRGRAAIGIFVFIKKPNIEWMSFHTIPFSIQGANQFWFIYTTVNTKGIYLNTEYYTNNEQHNTLWINSVTLSLSLFPFLCRFWIFLPLSFEICISFQFVINELDFSLSNITLSWFPRRSECHLTRLYCHVLWSTASYTLSNQFKTIQRITIVNCHVKFVGDWICHLWQSAITFNLWQQISFITRLWLQQNNNHQITIENFINGTPKQSFGILTFKSVNRLYTQQQPILFPLIDSDFFPFCFVRSCFDLFHVSNIVLLPRKMLENM